MAARKRVFSFRLSEACAKQLAELAARTGRYQNILIEIAVGKLHQQRVSETVQDVERYVFDEPAIPAESDDDETIDISEDE